MALMNLCLLNEVRNETIMKYHSLSKLSIYCKFGRFSSYCTHVNFFLKSQRPNNFCEAEKINFVKLLI